MNVHITIRKGPRIAQDVLHSYSFEHTGPAKQAVVLAMVYIQDWLDHAPDEQALDWTDFIIGIER